jgi:hypothetical protein
LPGPTGLDLAGRRLALAWDVSLVRDDASRIRLVDTRRRTSRVQAAARWERAPGARVERLLSPTVHLGRLQWSRACLGPGCESSHLRVRIATGARSAIPAAGVPAASAMEGLNLVSLTGAAGAGHPVCPDGGCALERRGFP